MTDATALILRMLFSLVVVLGVIGAIYWVVRRRPSFGGAIADRSARRSPGQRPARAALQVLGRVNSSKSTSITAIQFGEQVFLVSSNDQSPATVLASISRDQWDGPTAPPEPEPPVVRSGAQPRGVVDSLREITVRHG